MSNDTRLLLDRVFDHELEWRERVWLSQPLPGGGLHEIRWGEALDEARRMATHLRALGIADGDRVAILSKNCAHWLIAELAIWMAGGATVGIFASESPEIIAHVLQDSDAKLIFIGKLDAWPRQSSGVPETLRRIALPLAPSGDDAGVRWARIVADHAPLPGRPGRAATDLAMLIYTSGSTGLPKGVMHDFGHITHACEGIVDTVGYTPQDRFLSYLPLAHVFERAYVACASMLAGGHIFFADTPQSFVADLRRARPTLFISVPRLWSRFQQGVFEKIAPARLDFLLGLPLIGRLVAARVLAGIGLDKVRIAGSGSAPIPAELIRWYQRLGLNLLEGYAMSEDFAYSHMSRPGHGRPGWVGQPFPGVEVRIADDGEVLIRSPGCMVGYHKRPDLDALSFTEDGFFRTGDQGERDAQGMLRLTGRVKELFKTAKGKYIAPAPIENLLAADPRIESVMVTGVGQVAPCALVVLAEAQRERLQTDAGERETLTQALGALLSSVNAALPAYERLRMLVVVPDVWSVDNGLLTPTMKTRRARIEAQTASNLAQWYAQPGPVVWA